MKQTIALVGLALLCVGFVSAQETTGEISGTITSQDGQALPGVTVEVANPAIGFERMAVTKVDGRFKSPALTPGSYTVTTSLDGFQTQRVPVAVVVGQTTRHDVEMGLGAFSDVVEVTGRPPLLDPTSTVSGLTANTDELSSRLPVSRDVTRLSLLAPGTVPGDQTFENENYEDRFTPGQSLVSFGGAAINENTYLVNGLNITSLSTLMGSSFVPMEFVDQVQVKTGGYGAEFGRSTGGVVNLVTKSGTNELRGGFSAYFSPQGLQEQEPDTFRRDSEGNVYVANHNQDEERRFLEANASVGGPLLRDRLFFFAFVRWVEDEALVIGESRARRSMNSAPYWGAKLDWRINSSHSFEGTYLSDRTDVEVSQYEFDPETRSLGDFIGDGIVARGGDNIILRYSGLLSDSLLLSAQAGRNEFNTSNQSGLGDECPVAYDVREGYYEEIGCWTQDWIGRSGDQRTAYRVDLDWYIGHHTLRAGVDLETNRSTDRESYSGDIWYEYYVNGVEGDPPDYYIFPDLPWDQELVGVSEYLSDGTYDAVSNAAYVRDMWAVTPALTLDIGVRWERFENKNANGESILEISNQYAPRIGAAWDPRGDGRSKVYGHFGIYHLPMSTTASVHLGQRYLDQEGAYILDGGINPDGSPEHLGEELYFVVYHPWGVSDPRSVIDSSLDPMSQNELVLGYERLLGDDWTLGIRGVVRKFNQILEDVYLDRALYEVYGVEECYGAWCFQNVLTNPGTDFSGWYDLDGDGELDPIQFTAEEMRFVEADRRYGAVELSLQRRFADGWMFHGSYAWSHSYGNYEGLVNSDVNQVEPYFTITFDAASLQEHADGNLPNDRRHSLKIYGMHAWPWGLQAGGFLWYRSGRPVNGRGIHPTDPWARWWRAFYVNDEPCPRGCNGRTDSTWALDLSLGYDFPAVGADWRLRLEIFNVFNNDTITEVNESGENRFSIPNPNYLMPTHHQSPRSIRLGFGASF